MGIVVSKAFNFHLVVQKGGTEEAIIMLMSTPYKHPKTNIYYLRRAVPIELRELIGKTEIKKSLGTKDPTLAKSLFARELAKSDALFANARNGFKLTKKNAQFFAGEWLAQALDDDNKLRDSEDPEAGNIIPEDWSSHQPAFIMLDDAGESGDPYLAVKDEVDSIIEKHSLPFKKGDDGHNLLSQEVHLMMYKYHRAIEKRADGDYSQDIDALLKLYPIAKPDGSVSHGKGLMLNDLLNNWVNEEGTSPKTVVEFRRAIRRFEELNKNVLAISITKVHVRAFKTSLLKMPSNLNSTQLKMTFPEVLESVKGQSDSHCLSVASINKHLSAISAILSWSEKNGYFESSPQWNNPVAGLSISKRGVKTTRLPMDIEDINVLLNSRVYSENYRTKSGSGEAAYWLPLLALFTGGRLGELGQLLVSDIKQKEDIWYLSINEHDDGKHLKNKSSTRLIPIHQKLIKIGFLKYIDSLKSNKVFPELIADTHGSLTGNWSKWFSRYKKSIGLTDKRKVFHSFRHTFKDALRNSEVDEALSDALTGHTNGSVGRQYGQGYTLEKLNKAIQSIEYDIDVNWS